MKRVLVTGGAGFIGSHTVDLLLQQGYEVIVLDNLETGKLLNLDLFHPAIRVVQRSVLDYPSLVTEMSRCDAVLHLAALSSVPHSIEDPIQSLKTNTLGFVYILQALREINRPLRLVYASSAAVYGKAEKLPCSDEDCLSAVPLSPYAMDKVNNERYAALYQQLFGLPSLGLRYFNVYGPRQDPLSPYSGVITHFLERYKKNEPITVFGNGEQSRDFIYVGEVARANVLALQSNYCGILNIATGVSETLQNLLHYMTKIYGKKAEILYAPSRAGDILHSYGTIQQAEKYLGFSSATRLEQGLLCLCETFD